MKSRVEKKISGEWDSESDIVKEKVERKREKGLEILEKQKSEKKSKKKTEIDKNRLRQAIGEENINEDTGPKPHPLVTDETRYQ